MVTSTVSDSSRVSFVTHSLHANFTRKRWNRVSARQWINRLLVLFQRPIIFLIYRRNPDDGQWMLVFHSHRDYMFSELFHSQVVENRSIHKPDSSGLTFLESSSFFSPSPIPQTPFGILLVEVQRIDDKVSFSVLKNDANEYALMSLLWDDFLNSPYSLSIGVIDNIKRNLDDLFENACLKIKPPKDTKESNETAEDFHEGSDTHKFIEKQIYILTSKILEPLYQNISNTPIASYKGKTPANIFLTLRYYDRDDFRDRSPLRDNGNKESYPYSMRIILPPSQEYDLRKTFSNMKESSHSGGKWTYTFLDRDDCPIKEEHDEFDDPHLRAWFWDTLNTEGGIDSFIYDLKFPFGKGTRGLADPALTTGFVHYRPSVFSALHLSRVSQDDKSKKEESTDVRRVVILHYLFSASSPPGSTRDSLGAMFVPIRVASRTYMSIAQTTIMNKMGRSVESDPVYFYRNAFFFGDVARHFVQHIRVQSRVIYLSQITNIFHDLSIKWLDEMESGNITPLDSLQDSINSHLDWLCRVWPYPRISIYFKIMPVVDTRRQFPWVTASNFHFTFKKTSSSPYYYHKTQIPISREELIVASEKNKDIDDSNGIGYLSYNDVKSALLSAVSIINKHVVYRRLRRQ